MEKELSKIVEKLEWPDNDEYLKMLEEALNSYHEMVDEGILIPRGNNVATTISSNYNKPSL